MIIRKDFNPQVDVEALLHQVRISLRVLDFDQEGQADGSSAASSFQDAVEEQPRCPSSRTVTNFSFKGPNDEEDDETTFWEVCE